MGREMGMSVAWEKPLSGMREENEQGIQTEDLELTLEGKTCNGALGMEVDITMTMSHCAHLSLGSWQSGRKQTVLTALDGGVQEVAHQCTDRT